MNSVISSLFKPFNFSKNTKYFLRNSASVITVEKAISFSCKIKAILFYTERGPLMEAAILRSHDQLNAGPPHSVSRLSLSHPLTQNMKIGLNYEI